MEYAAGLTLTELVPVFASREHEIHADDDAAHEGPQSLEEALALAALQGKQVVRL